MEVTGCEICQKNKEFSRWQGVLVNKGRVAANDRAGLGTRLLWRGQIVGLRGCSGDTLPHNPSFMYLGNCRNIRSAHNSHLWFFLFFVFFLQLRFSLWFWNESGFISFKDLVGFSSCWQTEAVVQFAMDRVVNGSEAARLTSGKRSPGPVCWGINLQTPVGGNVRWWDLWWLDGALFFFFFNNGTSHTVHGLATSMGGKKRKKKSE